MDGDKSKMTRETRVAEHHKAIIIDTVDTSQQRAERLEVLSEIKQAVFTTEGGGKS